jgi:rubrerythrin
VKDFSELSEREILALAISNEEEDARIYADYAEAVREHYPATAEVFQRMAEEENEHRHRLIELYRQKFGEHIPLIRRQDVRGFISRKPLVLMRDLRIDELRRQAELMELETRRFYQRAASRSTDASIRQLLGDLAMAEAEHEHKAEQLISQKLDSGTKAEEEATRRQLFVLRYVQPGLAGLMDGSVSTLAPLFAAAFATGRSWDAFVVGLAASLGAGVSMGFAEALSDDGSLTGRGTPLLRGLICGVMTALGGLGHSLPYLIPDFWTATTLAIAVVIIELALISWVRWRFMETSPLAAALQVALGGAIVFGVGVLIGAS